jgi:hypothetical protein
MHAGHRPWIMRRTVERRWRRRTARA